MRIVDQDFNDVVDPDLLLGYLINGEAPKIGALETIDRIEKFGLEPEDYEPVQIYYLHPIVTPQQQLADLQAQLAQSDRRVLEALESLLPREYASLLAERQAMRDELSIVSEAIESSISNNPDLPLIDINEKKKKE